MKWKNLEEALLTADDAAGALRNLYSYWKAKDQKYSMTYLAKTSGLSSSGHVSDLISGRRRIQVDQSSALAKALHLGRESRQLFRTLIQLDHVKEPTKRAALQRRREVLRKALKIDHRQSSAAIKDMTLVFEVFCAFSLFANRPTLDDLLDYFGRSRKEAIHSALDTLRSLNVVASEGGYWKLLVDHIIFDEGAGSLSHINFLKDALLHACRNVETWYPQKEMAYFTSSIISVQKNRYQGHLQDLRSKFVLWQSELESGDADGLVRCNIQVYPIQKE